MEDDIFLQLSNLINGGPSSQSTGPITSSGPASPYGAADSTMFTSDNMVYPDVKPKKGTDGRRSIVVIDDDFSTLDLMKIYLQRDYNVETFDNPKNAIFFLNGTIPDMIFIDCYLNVMSTKKVLDIVKTFEKVNGIKIPYSIKPRRAGDIAECYASPQKAKKELDWEAEFGIEEMCRDSWNWQKGHPNGFE